jgi:hypothetical protein
MSGLDFWLVLAAGALIGGCLMAIWGQAWRQEADWQWRQTQRWRAEAERARRDADSHYQLSEALWRSTPWHSTLHSIREQPEVET